MRSWTTVVADVDDHAAFQTAFAHITANVANPTTSGRTAQGHAFLTVRGEVIQRAPDDPELYWQDTHGLKPTWVTDVLMDAVEAAEFDANWVVVASDDSDPAVSEGSVCLYTLETQYEMPTEAEVQAGADLTHYREFTLQDQYSELEAEEVIGYDNTPVSINEYLETIYGIQLPANAVPPSQTDADRQQQAH